MDTLALITSFVLSIFSNKPVEKLQNPQVLAASTESQDTLNKFTFNVQSPAFFFDTTTFEKDIVAPNVVYSVNGKAGDVSVALTAGDGITVDGLKVTNSGIKSLSAGTGITVDGNKITNSGITSLTAGSGITISGSTITNSLDLSASGWTDSGTTLKLTTITDSVGIGIAAPTSALHVVGSTNLAGAVTLGASSADAITVLGSISAGSTIKPSVDLGADLGSSLLRFNNLWVANINSNSSQAFSGQTTFSYAPTDTTLAQASVIINPTTAAANGQLLYLGVAGYQKALIDEDGDIILGYSDATSAPASDYTLNIYGHSGTRVAYIDTSGNIVSGSLTSTDTSNTAASFSLTNNTATTLAGVASLTFNALTSGTGLNLTSTSTGLTGDLANITASGSNAANTGNVLKIGLTGALSTGTALNVTSAGASGFALRVNDDGTYTDSTPLVVDYAGNVGIGTTAPGMKLDVNGDIRALGRDIWIGIDDGQSNASNLWLGGQVEITGGTVNTGMVLRSSQSDAWSPTNGNANFKFTSISDGNFANTSTSGTLYGMRLQNFGQAATSGNANWRGLGLDYIVNNTGTTAGAIAEGIVVDATETSLTGTTHRLMRLRSGGTDRFVVLGDGNVGIGTTAPVSKLHVSGAVTGKALAIFNETGDQALLTASSSGVTKFTIDTAGKVGIGIAPTYALDVKASGTGVIARFASDNSTSCTLATDGTISCTSDQTLKKNIDTINYGLSDVMKLNPVAFNWNFNSDDATKSLGFIAQDVEEIIPGLVSVDGSGLRSLNTIGFVPVLTKAIQELQLQIDEIKLSSASASVTNEEWSFWTNVVNEIKQQILAWADKFRTKELCLGEEDNETCIKKDQLDELIKLLPTPTASPTATPATTIEPSPVPTGTESATPTTSPISEPTI